MRDETKNSQIYNFNVKDIRERKQSIEELFDDIASDIHALDTDTKLRLIEAFFYIRQQDIRQAMIDFDALEDADRIVASYILQKLARKGRNFGNHVSTGQPVAPFMLRPEGVFEPS